MLAEIEFAEEEKLIGKMAPERLTAAVHALREDGIVILKDLVDTAHLDVLQERMLADLDTILARPDTPFNFNTGNLQQDPPPFPPYLFKDILVNELIVAITSAVLGPHVRNSFYSGNTALSSGTRQPVHPDVAQLWPHLEYPTPAFGLVVNIPLVDMDERNGSTEVWPGTHLDTQFNIHQGSLRIPQEVLDARAAVRPPLQPSVKRGSVVIRDIRLWHAGMPNHTDIPRPMIAMIHWCSWWTSDAPIPFPKGTEDFFKHDVLYTHAHFVEGEIDYLKHNAAYDLQK